MFNSADKCSSNTAWHKLEKLPISPPHLRGGEPPPHSIIFPEGNKRLQKVVAISGMPPPTSTLLCAHSPHMATHTHLFVWGWVGMRGGAREREGREMSFLDSQ